MNEQDFHLICVLGETGNITKAAQQLFSTQPALSKRIRLIETELNVPLLYRSRQGVRFTAAGEEVLQYSKTALRSMGQLRQNLALLHGEVRGTLRAGVSINFAIYALADPLAAYHRQYPKVELDISSGQSRHLYKMILEQQLDIAILRGEYSWDGVQYLLSQERLCLVRSSEYADCPLNDSYYINRRTDTVLDAQIRRWFRENGLTPQSSGIYVDNIITCLELVNRGVGWAILPEIALKNFGGFVQPLSFQSGEPFNRLTNLLCQRDASRLPQVETFVRLIREYTAAARGEKLPVQ